MTVLLRNQGADATPLAGEAVSDIHDHFRQPTLVGVLHGQAVIGNRLHFVEELMAARVQRLPARSRAQSGIADVYLELAEQDVLRIEVIKKLLEPIEEQEFPIVAGQRSE